MPWCPKCKNEYKEGITVCVDCGCELVDSLEDQAKPVYFGEEDEILNMIHFLKANGYMEAVSEYNEQDDCFELVAKAGDSERIKKMIQVYLKEIASREKAEEEEVQPEPTKTVLYEESGKKAEDYRTGAGTLLLVGTAGIIVLVLLNLGVLPIHLPLFTQRLTTGVMGVLFLIFVVLGISSLKSYHTLKNKAKNEETEKEQLLAWVTGNLTGSTIDAQIPEDVLQNSSKEELYFKRNDRLKEILKNQSPESTDAFIDYMIEEIYENLFEE